MNIHIKDFLEFSPEDWDINIQKVPEIACGHSYNYIKYQSLFQGVVENRSFICFDDRGTPLAICPLIVSKTDNGSLEFNSNGAPIFAPALADLKPSPRRKLLDQVMEVISQIARDLGVTKGDFVRHPLNVSTINRTSVSEKHSFELLRYNLINHVVNTLVVDLKRDPAELESNLSKYHRRNIRRASKQGISVRVVQPEVSSKAEIQASMEKAQQLHYKSAGRMTRPQETWDIMTKMIEEDQASLFLGELEGEVISFLHCGNFHKMAFGWSQANLEEYEKDYYVRHLVEWEAILFYKKKGYEFYELGERYFGPQINHNPTTKELTIARFKQNYGGEMLPKIFWRMYFDEDFMKKDLKSLLINFEDHYLTGNKVKSID